MKFIRKLSVLVLGAAVLCALCIPAFAAATASLEPDRTGSVTVTLYSSEEDAYAQDGVLTLYQVADVSLDNGNMVYTYTEAFTDCGVVLDPDNLVDLAADYSAWVTANAIEGISQEVSTEGTAQFQDLSLGLYLVCQTDASSGFYAANPFLVSVPLENDVTGAWEYDVDASPKVELTPSPEVTEPPEETQPPEETETPEPSETPNEETSEETDNEPHLPQTGQLNWPIPVLAVGGLATFAGGWKVAFGKSKKDEED